MTCLERVLRAISLLRDHWNTLVNNSEVTRLRGELEASNTEKLRITEALEGFVMEVLPVLPLVPDEVIPTVVPEQEAESSEEEVVPEQESDTETESEESADTNTKTEGE